MNIYIKIYTYIHEYVYVYKYSGVCKYGYGYIGVTLGVADLPIRHKG